MPKVWIADNGIVWTEYENKTIITFEEVRTVYDRVDQLIYRKHPHIIKIDGLLEFEEKAQKYLFSKGADLICSLAIVIKVNPVERPLLADYVVNQFILNHPPFPITAFDNEEEAVEWLEEYLE